MFARTLAVLLLTALGACQDAFSRDPTETIVVTVESVVLNHRQTLLYGTDASGRAVRINCDQGAYGRRIELGKPQEFRVMNPTRPERRFIDCDP